jgi:hypothetical protein
VKIWKQRQQEQQQQQEAEGEEGSDLKGRAAGAVDQLLQQEEEQQQDAGGDPQQQQQEEEKQGAEDSGFREKAAGARGHLQQLEEQHQGEDENASKEKEAIEGQWTGRSVAANPGIDRGQEQLQQLVGLALQQQLHQCSWEAGMRPQAVALTLWAVAQLVGGAQGQWEGVATAAAGGGGATAGATAADGTAAAAGVAATTATAAAIAATTAAAGGAVAAGPALPTDDVGYGSDAEVYHLQEGMGTGLEGVEGKGYSQKQQVQQDQWPGREACEGADSGVLAVGVTGNQREVVDGAPSHSSNTDKSHMGRPNDPVGEAGAGAGVVYGPAVRTLLARTAELVKHYKAQDFSLVVLALVKLRVVPPKRWMQKMLRYGQGCLADASDQEFANLVWGVGQLLGEEAPPYSWVGAVKRQARKRRWRWRDVRDGRSVRRVLRRWQGLDQ